MSRKGWETVCAEGAIETLYDDDLDLKGAAGRKERALILKIKMLLAALALSACGGGTPLAPLTNCPSPFAYMAAESPDLCFDVQPAIDAVRAAGLVLNLDSVHLTVKDAEWWHDPVAGDVVGLTDMFNVYVAMGGGALTHELLHVTERPFILGDHRGWHDNGFYELTNVESYSATDPNALTAEGFDLHPCSPPTMPEDMAARLRARGYAVDEVARREAEVCQ